MQICQALIFIVSALAPIAIFCLALRDYKADKKMLASIKSLPKGAKMTPEQKAWLARMKTFDN